LIPSALNCKFFLSLDSRLVYKQCSVHKQLHIKTHPRQIEVPYLRHLAAAVEGCATVEGRTADEGRAAVEGCRRRRLSLYIFRFSFRFFFFLRFNHSNILLDEHVRVFFINNLKPAGKSGLSIFYWEIWEIWEILLFPN